MSEMVFAYLPTDPICALADFELTVWNPLGVDALLYSMVIDWISAS